MNRTQTIERLVSLAGPQGPLGTAEETERLRGALTAGEPITSVDRILDALAALPPLPTNVARSDVEFVAAELLAMLGEQPGVLEHLASLLGEPILRPVILDALALLADPAAAPALSALASAQLARPYLNERELIKLASALGCVGGEDALASVTAMRARGGWSPAVERELDIALEALQG